MKLAACIIGRVMELVKEDHPSTSQPEQEAKIVPGCILLQVQQL